MSAVYQNQRPVNGQWWKAKKADRGPDLFALARYLCNAEGQSSRRLDDKHHMRLYANTDLSGASRSPRERAIEALASRRGSDRQRYNLVASAVDTAASLIAQQRPRPMFLTSGGAFDLQRKARLRTRAIEGQFYDLKAYEIMPRVFIDGAVLGTGHVFGYLCEGRPKLERVLPGELVVDHDSCTSGSANEILRRYTMAREELIARFPEHAKDLAISEGPDQMAREDLYLTHDSKADRVLVVEGWHLGRKEDRSDGRHVLSVSNATLVDEPYTRRRLPFTRFAWSDRQVGYWGKGIVEHGRDAQWRINRLIARAERQNNLGGGFKLLVEGNSQVKVDALTNTDGEIIRYFGAPPQFLQAPGAHPSIMQEILDIREQFFSEIGISTMSAEGKKPAGLDSGAAQREHSDILSQRHANNGRAYENAYLDLADLLCDLNDWAAELDSSYSVDAIESRGRSVGMRAVKWSEVSSEEGDFRIRMFPTSALPTTPAGKMAQVQEWIATGFISRPFAMSLLDFPDIDTAARVELADLDFAMWSVERILEGDDVRPDEYSNLKLCADISRRARLQAIVDGCSPDVAQALADYSEACLATDKEVRAALAAQEAALQQAYAPAPMPGALPTDAQAAPPVVPMGAM